MSTAMEVEPAALGEHNTVAEYQAGIAHLEQTLTELAHHRIALKRDEDVALFGGGNVEKVRKELEKINAREADIESRLEGARRRIQVARHRENIADIDATGAEIRKLAEQVTEKHQAFFEGMEAVRACLYDVEPLVARLNILNLTLRGAGRNDLTVEPEALRRAAIGKPAKEPALATPRARKADRILTSFYSLGGPLSRRGTLNPTK